MTAPSMQARGCRLIGGRAAVKVRSMSDILDSPSICPPTLGVCACGHWPCRNGMAGRIALLPGLGLATVHCPAREPPPAHMHHSLALPAVDAPVIMLWPRGRRKRGGERGPQATHENDSIVPGQVNVTPAMDYTRCLSMTIFANASSLTLLSAWARFICHSAVTCQQRN